MAEQKSSGVAAPLIKLVLLGLGGLVAVKLMIGLLYPLMILGVIGGAGYINYRLFMGSDRAIEGGKERKALSADDDFERKMRELDAIDRKLDEQIRKRS